MLWKRSQIEALRVQEHQLRPLNRIVVAIDPNASSEEDSNECGIVCAGLGDDGHAYVLDDISGVMAPNEWARTAIRLLRERMGDRIIAETNNGGEMVENTLRMVDPSVPYSAVWASRGKVTRAEPISALYEQGRVHHVGAFPRLEDQMCAFTVDFDRRVMGHSPDRVDALVWAWSAFGANRNLERGAPYVRFLRAVRMERGPEVLAEEAGENPPASKRSVNMPVIS